MRVRLLHAVANDRAGAVVDLDDRRALGLVRCGYAELVSMPIEPEAVTLAVRTLSRKAATRRREAEVR